MKYKALNCSQDLSNFMERGGRERTSAIQDPCLYFSDVEHFVQGRGGAAFDNCEELNKGLLSLHFLITFTPIFYCMYQALCCFDCLYVLAPSNFSRVLYMLVKDVLLY